MTKIIIFISICLFLSCTKQASDNNGFSKFIFAKENVSKEDSQVTNYLDSIRFELSFNRHFVDHLDDLIVLLDLINFSKTQTVLVDTFYSEYGLRVIDKDKNSPVQECWQSYRSKTLESLEEIQARKIALKPQKKIRLTYRMTKKLDFELRNKIVPKGEYQVYYVNRFYSSKDSIYVKDSTSFVKFYLKKDCTEY
jgi:hypothetical protein